MILCAGGVGGAISVILCARGMGGANGGWCAGLRPAEMQRHCFRKVIATNEINFLDNLEWLSHSPLLNIGV